jgi:lysozyme family protein/peptidoglycan hydrolase-like protein with peptidoglycan-binding domain
MAQSFEELKPEYAGFWRSMQVRPERTGEVDRIARTLLGHKPRYEEVARTTGVPWSVIAVLHQRESDADFRTYLGNGEPLNRKTRIVPAGRGPFPTWEAGAIDALQYDALDKVREWTPERACYEIEKFNGFGYRGKHVNSPYLWSYSNIYSSGKYVSDGQFSPSAVDQQCGAMPVLKRIMELDASVRFDGGAEVVRPDDGSLATGAIGERVQQLQAGLAQLGFEVRDIDGEYGPITAAAVTAFQAAYGLPPTGIADQVTQQVLARAQARGPTPSDTVKPQDILHLLFSALLKAQPAAPSAPTGAQQDTARDVLQIILGAFMGRQGAQVGPGPLAAHPPILSPIDNMLGGQALAGKKTAMAVVAYAGLAILQAVGVVGAATPAGQIATVLITAFGALGGLSKVDRVVQALGIIATKVPR